MWDLRTCKERCQLDGGPYSANGISVDKAGKSFAIATDDGSIKIFNEDTTKLETTLKGHEDSVQDVVFDRNSKMIISASSDCTFRVWQ